MSMASCGMSSVSRTRWKCCLTSCATTRIALQRPRQRPTRSNTSQTMLMPSSPYQYISPIGLPEEANFNPHADFTGCKICGDIYQSELDRKVQLRLATPRETIQATVQRKNWSKHHAKQHTDRQHKSLALSGRFCTPEAAQRLAAWGVIGIPLAIDAPVDGELRHALATAPRMPDNTPES